MSGRVARAVGAPAEDVHLTAAAVSASRVREQHTVRLATEQPDARLRRVRRVELARDRERSWRAHEWIRGRIGLRGPRGVTARHPLVEQECGRAYGGIAQEPSLPDPLPPLEIERVVQRDHRHADVVRHRCANDGGTIGEGLGPRIIDCVEEPIRSVCTDALEHRKIAQRLVRRDGEGERARIRSDNELAAESALERKIGDTERTVLIRIVPIAHVVRGLGKAPRHAPRVSVGNLSPHCGPMRLIEQRKGPRWHDEHRHEVLEHASTPRDERRAGVSRRERPAKVEPVLDRHVVLRDGDEARKPRLGGEQIVGTGIESSGACIVAEGEEAPLFVVEQREIHRHRQCPCSATDFFKAQRVGALRFHKRLAGRRERDEVSGQIAGVDRRDVRGIEHPQIVEVVPVHQVSAHLGHLLDGLERTLQPLEHLVARDETEVVRRHRRQQLQADVRRRRPRGDNRQRRLLEIVGDEPVRALVGKVLEEGPVRVCEPHGDGTFGRRQLQVGAHDRLAQAMRNLGSDKPTE